MNPIASEPVLSGTAVRLVVAFAARYGFDLSADDVLIVWAALETILGIATRQRVTPVGK